MVTHLRGFPEDKLAVWCEALGAVSKLEHLSLLKTRSTMEQLLQYHLWWKEEKRPCNSNLAILKNCVNLLIIIVACEVSK